MNKTTALNKLYESLQRRLRPEDVAELVKTVLGSDISSAERKILNNVTSTSLRRGLYSFSSMAEDFHCAVAPTRQVNKANELFATAYNVDATDPEAVLEFVRHISTEIQKSFGNSDFRDDRLNRSARKSKGLDISRRRYNKLFRFLARFESKLETYVLEMRKEKASRIAKSGLAFKIPKKDFMVSADAACFVAYFVARKNRRSQFTNQSQDRAFDKMSKMLFDRFKRTPRLAGWRIISLVMPDADVVKKLTKSNKMDLFAMWLDCLHDIADLLQNIWETSRFDRARMVVNRGDDSSTWNSLAGAWNAARQGWISTVYALGMEKSFDKVCFGKVMRLMAADVVRWHLSSGGQLEPDTLVWAELPAPWEVFSGSKSCTRALVEKVCKKHGVDPVKKNWTKPVQGKRQTVEFKPTPELVHGVAVTHPGLATMLKKAGWFSGKSASDVAEAVVVERDEHGSAIKASFEEECPV